MSDTGDLKTPSGCVYAGSGGSMALPIFDSAGMVQTGHGRLLGTVVVRLRE